MPTCTIDAVSVTVPDGAMVLDAAKKAGVAIPTLCFLEGFEPLGACRVCMVEVEGVKSLAAACSFPVGEGMKVRTNTRRVREARRTVVELLLSEHDGNCQTCERNEDCELQRLAYELGIRTLRYEGEKTKAMIDDRRRRSCGTIRSASSAGGALPPAPGVQGVGALFPQKRGFADGHRSGVHARPRRRFLRPVRPVRRRMSGGRDC